MQCFYILDKKPSSYIANNKQIHVAGSAKFQLCDESFMIIKVFDCQCFLLVRYQKFQFAPQWHFCC